MLLACGCCGVLCRWDVPRSGVQPLIPSDLMLFLPPEMILSIVDGSAVLCLIVVLLRELVIVLKFCSQESLVSLRDTFT